MYIYEVIGFDLGSDVHRRRYFTDRRKAQSYAKFQGVEQMDRVSLIRYDLPPMSKSELVMVCANRFIAKRARSYTVIIQHLSRTKPVASAHGLKHIPEDAKTAQKWKDETHYPMSLPELFT